MMAKLSFHNLFHSIASLAASGDAGERKSSPKYKAQQQEIENAVLVLAAEVVGCNKNFSSGTEKYIQQYLVKHFGDEGNRQRSTTINSHLEIGTGPFIKIACKQLCLLTTYDSRLNILSFLFGVAAADDFVNAKEMRCMHRIAGYLGITDADFKEIKLTALAGNNPYYILGVEEHATLEEVRVAYRKMVLAFHPDKRNSQVTEQEANRKFDEIKRAFEAIKQQHKK